MTQVGTLYKCDADGSNIRALSANVEHDNTPWVLSNGQVAYMRWEYVDRFHMGYHHLWSMNPDGTRQMVLYGNQINHGTILAPKPVPHSPKLVVTWSPGHGMREHYGRIALIDPRLGPDDPQGVQYISQGNIHCDPWALSENHFLVANKTAIELLNGQGETEVLYRLPEELAKQGYWIGEPRPVMKREREPVIADETDPSADHGTLALVNIYKGRKMRNVKPGTIKNLLVYEVLPKPINYAGAMSEMSAGGTFSVERLIGSVPVSEDGSAYFKLPAVRSFLFLAMDEKGHCVKRMHSFTSVMPGETTTCIGCHEHRTETPSADDRDRLFRIMRTQPVDPEPVAGVPEIFDFLRDIQPILDEHCLECHNHDREEGGFNISGHWGPLYPIGYIQMSWRQLFGDNRIILPYSEHSKSNFEPYEIGTGSSRLLKLIEEGHEGVNMPEPQQKIIRHWLDAGANHAGTYAVNSHGTIGYYLHSVNVRNDKDWPETQAMVEVMNRRCDRCHAPTEAEKQIGTYKLPAHFYARYYPPEEFQKNRYVAHTMSEDGGRFNRHLIYNLSYPELSKAARAPLAKEAGGLGVCQAKSGETVFPGQDRPGLSGDRRRRRPRAEAYSGREQPLLHDQSQSEQRRELPGEIRSATGLRPRNDPLRSAAGRPRFRCVCRSVRIGQGVLEDVLVRTEMTVATIIAIRSEFSSQKMCRPSGCHSPTHDHHLHRRKPFYQSQTPPLSSILCAFCIFVGSQSDVFGTVVQRPAGFRFFAEVVANGFVHSESEFAAGLGVRTFAPFIDRREHRPFDSGLFRELFELSADFGEFVRSSFCDPTMVVPGTVVPAG